MAIDTKRPIGGIEIVRRGAWVPESLQAKMRAWQPQSRLGEAVLDIVRLLPYDSRYDLIEKANELLNRVMDCIVVESSLGIKVIRDPRSPLRLGNMLVEDYGIVSRKMVTTTGVEELVDAFQSSGVSLRYYWHALGTSSSSEAVGNTALGSELTTAGVGASFRTSGTLDTGAGGAHIFQTVATITIDNVSSGTPMVIQEHGIFQTSAVGATGLWDKSLTGTQTLNTGDSLTATYQLTVNSGG